MGSLKVLVVDDEESITKITGLMLNSRGFTVDAFNHFDDALGAFLSNPTTYDVAILDYSMPEKTGLDLAREIHALNPGLPIILATGHLQTFNLDQSGPANVVEIIRKPFRVDDLVAAINKSVQT